MTLVLWVKHLNNPSYKLYFICLQNCTCTKQQCDLVPFISALRWRGWTKTGKHNNDLNDSKTKSSQSYLSSWTCGIPSEKTLNFGTIRCSKSRSGNLVDNDLQLINWTQNPVEECFIHSTDSTTVLLLSMEEILHQLIGNVSCHLPGFIHLRHCRISSNNTMSNSKVSWCTFLGSNFRHLFISMWCSLCICCCFFESRL